MSLSKLLLGASACLFSLAVAAQNTQKADLIRESAFSANKYNRPLGLNNFKNLPDNMLQQVGQKVSANGYPTRRLAAQLLRASNQVNLRHRVSSNVVSAPSVSASYTASDTLFWDSFEGWDGQTMPWIPTAQNKWTSKSNIDDMTPYLTNGSCPTWTTYEGDGYYVPYATNGDQMLVCMFGGEAYDQNGNMIADAPQQDEWLLSPAINGIEQANYLSFDICYSPWNSHYFIENGDSIFDLQRLAYDVEVLVTTSTRSASYNADDYDCVYRLSEAVDREIAATDMNDDNAVGQLLYMNWHHVQLPLEKYSGKNIRIALRYKGTKGGSVMVDAVRVSDLLPVAKYDIPQGSFYYGFSDNANMFQSKVALVPAYVPTVWKNYSNDDAQQFSWAFRTSDGQEGTSTDRDLQMPALQSSFMVDMPMLTATSGQRSDQFAGAYYKAGGNANYTYEDLSIDFNVGNFDPTKQYWDGQISAQGGSKIYAFGTGGGAFYGQLSNYYYNAVDGIGNFYEKPDAPYVFNKVLMPMSEYFNLGATLACTIYKVKNGDTITDEVIAQATATDAQQIAGGWFLNFNFSEPVVADDAIFVLIDGFSNNNILDLAPLTQALNHDSDKSYAFVKLNTSEGSFAIIDVANLLSSVEGGGNMTVSHCIGLNAVFPYLHSVDGDVFAAAVEGGSKDFAIDTYWNPNDWQIQCSDAWVKAQAVVDESAQTVSLQVTAEAMPATVSGRRATVRVSALGCEQDIIVVQGTEVTAIQRIETANGVQGMYTLGGVRVQDNAAHGIYLMKKDGKYIKVLR